MCSRELSPHSTSWPCHSTEHWSFQLLTFKRRAAARGWGCRFSVAFERCLSCSVSPHMGPKAAKARTPVVRAAPGRNTYRSGSNLEHCCHSEHVKLHLQLILHLPECIWTAKVRSDPKERTMGRRSKEPPIYVKYTQIKSKTYLPCRGIWGLCLMASFSHRYSPLNCLHFFRDLKFLGNPSRCWIYLSVTGRGHETPAKPLVLPNQTPFQ